MELKKCHKCGNSKPATDEYFYRKKGYLTSPCKDCQQKRQKKIAKQKSPRLKKDAAKIQKNYRTKNKSRLEKHKKSTRSDNRLLALWHYGGQPPECSCCGENRIQFLGIKSNSYRLYQQLRKQNFKPSHVVLCRNCYHARLAYGSCPHQQK